MRDKPRQHLLPVAYTLDRGMAVELPDVEFRDRGASPRLGERPVELGIPDPDSRTVEQHPVDRVVMVRVGQDDVGDSLGRQSVARERRDQQCAVAERADVDQRDVLTAPQQRDGAPAQPAVTHRFAGVTLHQYVQAVFHADYSTVTDFARLRGWSISVPFSTAT